ncbi:hypothetical protein [Crossiella cryophila]|uniref:Uncharacterized protein n=1 Tax=Crossiella cryophila TaxID=43355 RepID=A0A7W7CEF0_9PSEU|nr:hypothetical protein [Crossiella cryophila]MBB4678019.1 hypothetical protein [Crossiella cryophila]
MEHTDGPAQREPACVDVAAVLAAIWHEALPHRAAIHRALAITRCDLRLRSPGFGLDGDCACRDFLVDMLVECDQVLTERATELRNPLGAARVHMRLRAAPDWIRRRRTAMGAQARVDRIRLGARARTLPDEFHRALLEYLVDEAGSMAPLDNQAELIQRLSYRCAQEFGGSTEDHLPLVAAGLALVERHCRSGPRVNIGTRDQPDHVTWWDRYIDRPLGRRPRRALLSTSTTQDGPDTRADPHGADLTGDHTAHTDDAVLTVLHEALLRQPEDPAAALRTGIAALVAHDLLAEPTAAALLTDRSRFATATRELVGLWLRQAARFRPPLTGH